MNNKQILLAVSATCIVASLYFGFNTEAYISYGEKGTDWGKVVLATVFGFGGVFGLISFLNKKA